MATKYYGSLLVKTPVATASQGDFTAVNDATQQQYPLGSIWIYPDSSGRPRIIKYVQYNPTAAATWTQGAPLYYKDRTRTIVTNKVSEAETYVALHSTAIFSFAGVALNAVTPTVGNFCWIQTAGFSDKINCPASTAVGDILVLANSDAAPGDNTFIRVAAGTQPAIVEGILACVFLTDIGPAGGGLGQGWIQSPCCPV